MRLLFSIIGIIAGGISLWWFIVLFVVNNLSTVPGREVPAVIWLLQCFALVVIIMVLAVSIKGIYRYVKG